VELDLKSHIRNVLLRRDKIIAVSDSRIYAYTLADIPEHLFTLDRWNPNGLCAISHNDPSPILAFPSTSTGCVSILSLNQRNKRLRTIRAHDHDIQTITLNFNGSLIATSSVKGTLIRLFDTQTMTFIREFRRGANNASISW
jgi:WD40 repeat protein